MSEGRQVPVKEVGADCRRLDNQLCLQGIQVRGGQAGEQVCHQVVLVPGGQNNGTMTNTRAKYYTGILSHLTFALCLKILQNHTYEKLSIT